MTRMTLPPVEPPDLWPEIEQRLSDPRPVHRVAGRLAAAVVALLVFVSSGLLLWRAFTPERNDAVGLASGALDAIPGGWTRLPDPPEVRLGASYVWTGTELLAWGGCDPSVREECAATADGYALDPTVGRWSRLAAAPAEGAHSAAIWTGSEALFLALDGPVRGVALDPERRAWRSIAEGPLDGRTGAIPVWTGSRVFVWGGGEASLSSSDGAMYDPGSDEWTVVAPSPISLNSASGVWTGDEVIVFGSLLGQGNRARTETAVGAAYDPEADAWRTLPASRLSPQATSAVWVGGRMVAWDYEPRSQEYDPGNDRWGPPIEMPFEFDECYPDSLALGDLVFAFYCGRAALYDTVGGTWEEIDGGIVEEEIWSDAYERFLKVWRFADLVPAGPVAFLAAEGITLNPKGVACYGCPGSPTSLWAFRPG
ncbi:MAG TPA: hypothetical protein VF058_07095 [Actinomycetota bacterium]